MRPQPSGTKAGSRYETSDREDDERRHELHQNGSFHYSEEPVETDRDSESTLWIGQFNCVHSSALIVLGSELVSVSGDETSRLRARVFVQQRYSIPYTHGTGHDRKRGPSDLYVVQRRYEGDDLDGAPILATLAGPCTAQCGG